jgi:hypothetical protein
MGKGSDAQSPQRWYIVSDPTSRESHGPFSVKEIVAKVQAGEVDVSTAWAFNKGDTSMIPLKSIPGVERRGPLSAIEAPVPNDVNTKEWYMAGADNKPVGPFTLTELKSQLSAGIIDRQTYVWKKGMENWLYLHQVPGFDRRSA